MAKSISIATKGKSKSEAFKENYESFKTKKTKA